MFGYGIAAGMPRAVLAQQPAKTRRIAIVSPATRVAEIDESNKFYGPFLEELRRLGYIEGQNLVVERYSGRQVEHYPEMVSDVVRSSPDVVFASTVDMLLALKAQTTTIPIVAVVFDPVTMGFAE